MQAEQTGAATVATPPNSIQLRRLARGFTQQHVANAVGTVRETVSRWETGQSWPDAAAITALARFYGISRGHICEELLEAWDAAQAHPSAPAPVEAGRG